MPVEMMIGLPVAYALGLAALTQVPPFARRALAELAAAFHGRPSEQMTVIAVTEIAFALSVTLAVPLLTLATPAPDARPGVPAATLAGELTGRVRVLDDRGRRGARDVGVARTRGRDLPGGGDGDREEGDVVT